MEGTCSSPPPMLFQFSAIYANACAGPADLGRAHRPCLCPPQIPEFCLWASHSARRSHPPASAHSSSQPGSGLGRPPPPPPPPMRPRGAGPATGLGYQPQPRHISS